MDTAEYETNTLVTKYINSVCFAFYEPVTPTAFVGPAALEVEDGLRGDGLLPYLDTARRGMWCFRLRRKGQTVAPWETLVQKGGYSFALAEEGSYEPAGLARNRSSQTLVKTPTSSSSSINLEASFRNAQLPAIQPGHQFPPQAIDAEQRNQHHVDVKGIPTPAKSVHEHLISAILSAISSGFCAKTGATPLNTRNVLLPRTLGETAILGSFRVYVTTTGALVISLSLSPVAGLAAVSDYTMAPPPGIPVLAAPLGVLATCHAWTDSEQSSAHSATSPTLDLQPSRARSGREVGSQSWRSMCGKVLQARKIFPTLAGSQRWITLQRIIRKGAEQKADGKWAGVNTPPSPSVSWPSTLCFCRALSRPTVRGENTEERASTDESYDPILSAQTWFLEAGNREQLMTERAAVRDTVAATAASEARRTGGAPQHAPGLSPLALHRQVPVGGAQGAMLLTPEGAADASPNNMATTTVTTTAMVDVADAPSGLPSDSYHDGWAQGGQRREGTTNSFDSANLFGDLGPDTFGHGIITDDDFNFFDQQPGDMNRLLDKPEVAEMAGTRDMKAVPKMCGQAGPRPPVFAKPELKQANSSRAEEAGRAGPSGRQPAKRAMSPFNPEVVFRTIQATVDGRKVARPNAPRSTSHPRRDFDAVQFGPALLRLNSKYHGGRFDIPYRPRQSSTMTTLAAKDSSGRGVTPRPAPGCMTQLSSRLTNARGAPSQYAGSTKAYDGVSDDSFVSSEEDASDESDEPTSPVKEGRPRAEDEAAPTAICSEEMDGVDTARLALELAMFSSSETHMPLARFFADPEPLRVHVSLQDMDFIMAAQIITEQASTSSLHPGARRGSDLSLQSGLDRRRDLLCMTHGAIQDLRSILPSCVGEAVQPQFRSFIETPDVPLLGQPTRIQARPSGTEQMKPVNLFQIQPPHLEMRRYENKLSVLPSAVAFWESLGLGPSNGHKDISAISIYPDFAGVEDEVHSFMDRMQSTYGSLKLGTLSRLSCSVENGMLPYQTDTGQQGSGRTSSILGLSLMDGLSKLSDALAQLTVKDTNFVIFFIYLPDIAGAMVESCYAFQQIFERYKRLLASSRKAVVNEIVLQLVPMDLLASSDSVATPSPLDFARLCVETYDRCVCFGDATPCPAIVLEQPVPRLIDFRMTATPSSALMQENSCLHIAYVRSVDERWVSAAWTDNRGSQQMTASYCLGRKGHPISTPLTDVIREMWDTTHDLISTRKIHWRVLVAKSGVMEQFEVQLWVNLAQANPKLSVSLTLMTVDTDPSLQLIPRPVKIGSTASAILCTTPASTPLTKTLSPDSAATPSGRDRPSAAATSASAGTRAADTTESEADAYLVDVTDQSWGAVLSHRLNNSTSLTDLNPAIVSGYLVKRGGARVEDPPAVLEVNIVHCDNNPRAYEMLMREMLTQFRGLGTLARARGMVDGQVDLRPWHVAAAEKAVRALHMLM